MKRTPGQPVAFAIAIGAMVVLLPLIAWLQYRWIGEVSDAARRDMQAGLEREIIAFRQEFDVAVRNAVLPEQNRPTATPEELLGKWFDALPEKRVISEAWVVHRDERGIQIGRYSPENHKVVGTEWPADLQFVRGVLETGRPPVSRMPFALIGVRGSAGPGLPPEAWVVTRIDVKALETSLLPTVAQQRFGSQSPYVIEVRDTQGFVWRSAQESATFFDHPDFEAGIFDLPGARLPGITRNGMPGRGRGRGKALDKAGKRLPREAFEKGPPPGAEDGPPEADQPPPGNTREAMQAGQWKLVARFRSGSLDSVVASVQRRDLALSLVTLTLLAASSVMLILISRRSQKLAVMQMEFVAGVSHELRTPIAVMNSAADNLAEGIVEQESVAKYGNLIRREARRLARMVDDVMAFSGLEHANRKLRQERVVVADLVERALTACRPEIQQAACLITTNIPADLPAITGDNEWLEQALRNLIGNAAKYGASGKWIGVTAKTAGEMVELRVEDRGPGIDDSDAAHIFDPFYRGAKAVADQKQGSGIGLSVVRRIAEAHGGTVSLQKAMPQGCAFVLRLPVGGKA